MTATAERLAELRHPPRRPRPQWRRALRAMRELLAHPDRTELAFDIVEALDGDRTQRSLVHMLRYAEGRRVYELRPSLSEALDLELLATLPPGSFGRAYLDHIERYELNPGKLGELGELAEGESTSPEPGVRWLSQRGGRAHDLWHVLTGYGADQLGESALLAFSLAQTGGRANTLLTLASSLRVARIEGVRWLPYAFRAWRRGRRAVCLDAVPYEELLPLPLGDVRTLLGIEPPELAHPRGVYQGDPVAR